MEVNHLDAGFKFQNQNAENYKDNKKFVQMNCLSGFSVFCKYISKSSMQYAVREKAFSVIIYNTKIFSIKFALF